MPRKADWIHRIDQVMAELDRMGSPFIDRAALERLLGVGPRQALRILNAMPPLQQAGRNLVVGRKDLAEWLGSVAASGEVQWERNRRERVSEELARVRKQLAATNRQIPVDRDAPAPAFANLPEGVRLEPGRLEIRFRTGDELLGRLFELARAVAESPDGFQDAIGE